MANIIIKNISHIALLDTGASHSLITYNLARIITKTFYNSDLVISCANGQKMKAICQIKVDFKIGDKFKEFYFHVMSSKIPFNIIIGFDLMEKIGLVVNGQKKEIYFNENPKASFKIFTSNEKPFQYSVISTPTPIYKEIKTQQSLLLKLMAQFPRVIKKSPERNICKIYTH